MNVRTATAVPKARLNLNIPPLIRRFLILAAIAALLANQVREVVVLEEEFRGALQRPDEVLGLRRDDLKSCAAVGRLDRRPEGAVPRCLGRLPLIWLLRQRLRYMAEPFADDNG